MAKEKKAIIFATTAYMIAQFNKPNIETLKKSGYEVHIATNFEEPGPMSSESVEKFKQYLEDQNVEFYQISIPRNPTKIISMTKAYRQLRKIMDQNNYCLIHSHSPTGGVVGRLVANKYRKLGLKSIYTAHGFHFYKGAPFRNWLIFYPIEKTMSYFTDVLITINAEDYELSSKQFETTESKYIPGVGINLKNFYPLKIDKKNMIRKNKNISNDDFLLTYVAELNENKNQRLLIEAMNCKKTRDLNIKLLLIGSGPLFENYKEMIRKYNLEDNVFLLGYQENINEWLGITDCYVASSKREGLPVNILEAMAVGLPIIATKARGHSELVDNNKGGYLIEGNNPKEFNERIIELYNDRSKIVEFSDYNSTKVKKYSLENIKNHLHAVYR